MIGGIRKRLIHDNIYQAVYDAIETVGWFDSGRYHEPISFPNKSYDKDEIPINSLFLSSDDDSDRELELGSGYIETQTTFFLDFFTDSDTLGKHLIYDLRDILDGRYPSSGISSPFIGVLDLRQATPTELFRVGLEDFSIEHANYATEKFKRIWWSLMFQVIDVYGVEE